MMSARVIASAKKTDGFQMARIRRVKDRHTIAEHVTYIDVSAVDHDLNTVRPATNVAV
jgi:hypothetical protein